MTLKTIKQKLKKAKMSMMVIYLYGTGLITLFVMVIASWLANTAGYNTNTQILINFWNSYTTAAVIGAIGFVSIFSVDKMRDGESDIAEKKSIEGTTLNTSVPKMGTNVQNALNKIGR